MTEPSLRQESIFLQALEIPSPAERAAFLKRACGDEPDLRSEVEALLRAHGQSGDMLDLPERPAATLDEPAVSERPGTVIGPYKLLQQIGEGGMGTVFMAEQTHPVQRKVALKVIKAGMDSRQVISRFEAERQALAMMDHVNIARVLDAGATESGRPYFVMELVHGVPITKYCDDNHLTPRERLELFVPVCQAIQHAHQKGIIHRDIKPSNVMITLYDGKPVPKVIDFGVAKATEQKLTERTLFTQYGTMVGTLEYMSPEQAEMSALGADTRSDIFSLGVLLYELLTGSTPLTHKRVREAAYAEVLRLIKEEEPPRPSTRLSDSGEALASISAQRHMEPAKLTKLMRGELDWIVMKCLEKDRNRRYETANAFAADVQHYLHDEAVQACPPSAGYRFRKFARRNQVAFWTIGIVALALVVGTVVSAWQAVRATRAEGLADARLEAEKDARAATEAARIEEAAQRAIAERRRTEAEKERTEAEQQRRQAKEQELLARRRFYASQINLAHGAWQQGQPARVLELLEGQRPKFDQTDLRTFEWYYLWRRCHVDCRLNLHLQNAPENSAVALSPDGKTFATPWGNSDIKLWDVASGRERLTLKGRNGMVWSLAFAPDGQTLASGDSGRVILWDVSTGKAIKTLKSGQGPPRSLAFSPDGEILAAGGEDATVKLWNVATGQEETTLHGHTAGVLGVTFSPDGKTLASASAWGQEAGGVVNLWDLSVKPPKSRHRLSGSATVAFSPDGKTLASGSSTLGNVRLWDVATGKKRVGRNTNSGGIICVAYSPDGKTLAIGSQDRTLKLWEPESGRERSYAHHNFVQWVAFSPDGKTVASASLRDGAVNLWDVIPAPEAATLQNKGDVNSLAFSPDGRILATGGEYATKLWDVATGRQTATLPFGHPGYVGGTAFSHDGKTLAIASFKAVELVAVVNRQEQGDLQVHTSNIGSLAISPVDKGLLFSVKSLAFSPDDKTLAISGYNVSAKLWDLATRQVRVTLDGTSVAFSPDHKTFATGRGGAGQSGGRVTLWDAGTFKERITCQGDRDSWVFCVQFSPDGKLVAQTTEYGTVLLWDVASGALHASLKGHTSPVNCVAFHPDGKTLASASQDKTIKLWDVATGQERLTLTGHSGSVRSVAFAPDGNTLASGSADGTVKLWRAATDREAVAPRTELEPDEPVSPKAMIHQAEGLRGSGQPVAAEQIYREARSRLEKLAAAFPNEPQYRLDMAATFESVAGLLKDIGRPEEGEKTYRKGVSVLEKLVSEVPSNPEYREQLGHKYRRLILFISGQAGRQQEKERLCREAIKVFEKLAVDYPSISSHRYAAADTQRWLGMMLEEGKRSDEAEKWFRTAVEGFSTMPAQFLAEIGWHGDLHEGFRYLAGFLNAKGRTAEAEKVHRQRIELYRKLAAARPNEPLFKQELARSYTELGTFLKESGKTEEAAKAFQEGLRLYEELAQSIPGLDKAALQQKLGQLLRDAGRFHDADKAFHQAVNARDYLAAESPQTAQYQFDLSLALRERAVLLSNQLKKPKEAEELQRWALGILEKLAADHPNEPNYLAELGHSLWQLADISASLGRDGEAEKLHRQALGVFEKLAADVPSVAFYGQEAGFSCWHLGWLMKNSGRLQDAEVPFRQALTIHSKLAADFPNEPEYRTRMSRSYDELISILLAQGKQAEAEKLLRQALAAREKLVADFPTVPAYRDSLARSHHDLAGLLDRTRQLSEVDKEYRRAIAIWERLADDVPSQPIYRLHAAVTYAHDLAALLAVRGQAREAEEATRRALSMFEKVAAEFPKDGHERRVTDCRFKLAVLLAAGGRFQEAERVYSKILEQAPKHALTLNNLSWLLATCPDVKVRDPGRALKTAKQAVELAPKEGNHWNTLGAAHYRADDWKAAIAALEKSMELRKGGDAFDWFFLAMAHWKLNQKDQARKLYDRAVQWMDKNALKNEQLARLRAEAAELLKIDKKAPSK